MHTSVHHKTCTLIKVHTSTTQDSQKQDTTSLFIGSRMEISFVVYSHGGIYYIMKMLYGSKMMTLINLLVKLIICENRQIPKSTYYIIPLM